MCFWKVIVCYIVYIFTAVVNYKHFVYFEGENHLLELLFKYFVYYTYMLYDAINMLKIK